MPLTAEQLQALKDRDAANYGSAKRIADHLCFETGIFSYSADTGTPGTNQDALVARLTAFGADQHFLGGDNVYSPATIDEALAAFQPFLAAETLWPAFGNHDATDADLATQVAKFHYTPGNGRYYHKHFAKGNLDLVVLHSGVYHASMNEPDGIAEGSVQHAWFESLELTGRRLVIMTHFSPVTARSGGVDDLAHFVRDLDWIIGPADLVLTGHGHANSHIVKNGTHIVNCSSAVKALRALSASQSLYGENAGAHLVWGNDTDRMATRLVSTQESLHVDLWNIEADPGNVALVQHSFEI